jgi:hypothetical protein
MTSEEREKIREEVRAAAAHEARLVKIETDQAEILEWKRMLDRYKSWLAWAIVLGALALIARPFINAWDLFLSITGLGQ